MPEIDGVSIPFLPLGGIKELKGNNYQIASNRSKTSFNDIFAQELDKIKFSSHAQSRINSREIVLSENDFSRLESAINKADEKGAVESLIMLDENAFIVSIPNKTVITVVNKNLMESNVITDIDSAVFA